MPAASGELWTIGHSTRPFAEWLKLLQSHRIQALADVRRFPGSRRHPQFNQEAMAVALEREGIVYRHFTELGGRRPARPDSPNTLWRNLAFRGYADYMTSSEFTQAIGELRDFSGLQRTCIMCAEALWWECHRSLIADWFKADGWKVWHIQSNGKAVEHPFTEAAHLVRGRLSYSPEGRDGELWVVKKNKPRRTGILKRG